ncbi:MAG TPA: hypothetical protein DCS93_00980 [Microscillaceae bacterium]|nr:hypothetical protein [Microscillaceae bacterium]
MTEKKLTLTYFTNLYLVAMADGKVVAEEQALLEEVANKMGISNAEIEEIKAGSNEMDFQVPSDKKGRLEHLESLIEVMMIDGEIHDKEYQLCLQYADRSGCDQLSLDMLIEKVAENKQ